MADLPDGFSRTLPPVDPALFHQIATASLLLGFGATALFVAHQAIGTKTTRNVPRDIVLSLFASITLATGINFGLLGSGIWF
jgi:hypothetical protein